MARGEQIAGIFSEYATHRRFSGVGLVRIGDEVVFRGAHGYASRPWQQLNTLRTRFDTASITKLFTTVAVLQLIDDGLLSLDTPVIDFLGLDGTAISRDVTVYHLLTHTSGIGDDADEEAGESYEALWRDRPNYAIRETADFLPQFVHKPANFAPGAGCRYNNVGFVLLGLVVEKIAGQPYRAHVSHRVFAALDMKRTAFLRMDEVSEDVAEGYSPIVTPDGASSGAITGWRKNIYSYPPVGSPDSGAYTTAGDLDRFIRALRAGEVLSPGLTRELFTPQVDYRAGGRYRQKMGFGCRFFVTDDDEVVFLRKDGVNAGVACVVQYYPARDATVVILANQDCDVWQMAWEIHDLLLPAAA